MIARLIQIVCALYLVAMSLAAATHWWSLRDFTKIATSSPFLSPRQAPRTSPTQPATKTTAATTTPPAPIRPASPAAPSATPSSRDEFYTTLLRQIENLQNQNRDLIDQLAETNRELMKLEFRVDTHSSQFRPLPVTEERQEAYMEEDHTSVLPPRPLIIDEPFAE